MKIPKSKIPALSWFSQFQDATVDRLTWPYPANDNFMIRWRAKILFSILFGGLILGTIAFVASIFVILKEGAWGMAVSDLFVLAIGFVLLSAHRIKFEIRASIACLLFYFIGVAVIMTVGPQIGGPAWLFAFSVLAGVLLGNRAAICAVLMNVLFLFVISLLVLNGKVSYGFSYFDSLPEIIAAGGNFLVVNTIIALSVSVLLKGLNASEKRYRLIAENVADVIWTTDMNLTLTYISPSVRQMQGYTAEEYITKTVDEILTPESLENVIKLFEKKIDQVKSGDERGWQPEIFEAEQYRKDGSTIWTSMSARMLKGKDNKPAGVLGTTRDITEHKKDVSEKINAQIIAGEHKKLALVGRIAGKMAHDFNNVLGIIMGQTELALLDDIPDPELKKILELILNQTIRGKNLTKNLTSFAKSSEPRQEFFYINEKIEFVLNLIKNDLAGIYIEKQGLEQIEIMADPGMIEHALVNLLQNSIHALSKTQHPIILFRTYCSDKMATFEIEDNGCGIPEAHLDEIYEPSFTLKGSKDIAGQYENDIKGTGYGMANVKKYIELHKGKIKVDSTLGSGTRIIVSLPLIKKELTQKEKVKIISNKKYCGKRILLVEDEEAISQVQSGILSQNPLNHKVDIVANGNTAITMFNQNHYDLVSLDYVLSGKTNGKDVYDHIRKSDQSIPVLFISGNIEFLESIIELKQKDPHIDHISKPCQNIDYVNSISMLFEKTVMN